MRQHLHATWLGCRWLPSFGHHPGWLLLIAMPLGGALAAGWLGALVMLLFWGPLFLTGAHGRGRAHLVARGRWRV